MSLFAIRTLRLLPVLGLCLGLAAGPAAAAEAPDAAAVGTDGRLFMVHEGSYGDLFPGRGLADETNPALALEVVHPDQSRETLLVPDTEGESLEDSASVLFEDGSETLFILWQTKINAIHSRLNLVGFRDGGWTETIEISGNPFGWKSSPQLAVTRDRFTTAEDDGSLRTWKRTVVHLLWWEGDEEPQVLYTPVVLIDGQYSGWNPVYRLDDLAPAAGVPMAAPNGPLARAPRIETGQNGQSVVIGFVPASGGELVTVSVELMPGEISALADKVRHQIIDVGRELRGSGGNSALAGKVRHQIIDVGARLKLHAAVSSYLASEVHGRILASDPEGPVASLADDVRHQIIDVGAHINDRGFDRLSSKSVYQVVELPGGGTQAPPDLIRVMRVSSRALPNTGDEDHSVYLSRDGKGVIAAWKEGEILLYRESRNEGWSGVRRLRLVGGLDLPRAKSLLERRADELGAAEE
jgi:hypothetical protein